MTAGENTIPRVVSLDFVVMFGTPFWTLLWRYSTSAFVTVVEICQWFESQYATPRP